MRPGSTGAIHHIKETLAEFAPEMPFEYRFLDDSFRAMYREEERLRQVVSSFAILSILIACLGLFGLTAFAAEQRTKEIGIRKVLGENREKGNQRNRERIMERGSNGFNGSERISQTESV